MTQFLTRKAGNLAEAKTVIACLRQLGGQVSHAEARGWWSDRSGSTVFCGSGGIRLRVADILAARRWVSADADGVTFDMEMSASGYGTEINQQPVIEFHAHFND